MATMLHLELAQEAAPLARVVEAVRATATRLGLLARESESPDPLRVLFYLHSGLMVDVDPPFASGEDPFVADFGMVRAATVDYTFDSTHEGFERQDDELLRLTFALLAALPGDAVLHYEYSVVYLARLGGRLLLSDADDVWTPEDLVHVPEPYQRSRLAFRTM
jgi:hypothetical protein